ncbi:MAG: TAXI family TRAP transporter solute-binding subunit [Campylobacteraceae bacterium]|nr:TAXI family TRAP transporter solute-binding subunit [Campylobacteraceae bacterium]
MNKKRILLFSTLIIIVFLLMTYFSTNNDKVNNLNNMKKLPYKYDSLAEFTTIGTGGIKGTYYLTGNIISNYVNSIKKQTGIRLYVESTAGSIYNINAIKSGEFDFGIVQSDIAYKALKGEGKFKGNPYYKLKSVIAIYPELLTLITRKDSNINSLFSIQEKRINVGNKGSGNAHTIDQLLEENNISDFDFSEVKYLNIREASKALIDNKLDAYFSMSGHPSTNIINLEKKVDLKLISLNTKKTNELIKKYPYFTSGIIKTNTYKEQNKDIYTFGVKAVLVTSSNVSEKIVYTITKAIFENFEEFKQKHPVYVNMSKESLLKGLSLPLHIGARKYLEEIGLLK